MRIPTRKNVSNYFDKKEPCFYGNKRVKIIEMVQYTEHDHPDAFMLKLDNGYNVSVFKDTERSLP